MLEDTMLCWSGGAMGSCGVTGSCGVMGLFSYMFL